MTSFQFVTFAGLPMPVLFVWKIFHESIERRVLFGEIANTAYDIKIGNGHVSQFIFFVAFEVQ